MKITVTISMMLLISMLAISPAFGTTDDQPDPIEVDTCGAPNSGDGIPDGSGWDHEEFGAPNSGDGIPDGSGWNHQEFGAPNSGDGIPDGSGWESEGPRAYSPCPLIIIVG